MSSIVSLFTYGAFFDDSHFFDLYPIQGVDAFVLALPCDHRRVIEVQIHDLRDKGVL